jgi:pyruvate formate lyase activating enzyme
MKLAKRAGLYNVWVSNGYFSQKTLALIAPYLDAINVDLKFFDDSLYQKICGAHLNPILKNLQELKKRKIHLEITTLVIPDYTTINDQPQKIAQFIAQKLSKDTPWHITAFYPAYKMKNIRRTTLEELWKIYEIGKSQGLKYIHLGNI